LVRLHACLRLPPTIICQVDLKYIL
jgi:hypothetical protein